MYNLRFGWEKPVIPYVEDIEKNYFVQYDCGGEENSELIGGFGLRKLLHNLDESLKARGISGPLYFIFEKKFSSDERLLIESSLKKYSKIKVTL